VKLVLPAVTGRLKERLKGLRRGPVILFGIAGALAACAAGGGLWAWDNPAPVPITTVAVAVTHPVPKVDGPPIPSELSPIKLEPSKPTSQAVVTSSPPPVPPPPIYSAFSSEHGLPPAPSVDLIERGPYGFLPIIGHDGHSPWQVYARPFNLTDPSPRVAIIITGLAIASQATKDAIEKTPPDVTLAFAPFGHHVADWLNLARATGHEVLLELPMEPIDYPRQDPGYNTLLTAYDPPQNLDRLDWVMSQGAGYVGLIGRMGGKFQASRGDMTPILDEIARRGLLFVDNRDAAQSVVGEVAPGDKLPMIAADRVIDADPSRLAIDQALIDLINTAKRNGSALGLASATPVTLQEITAWAMTLAAQGVNLAPVSAVVTVPKPPPDKTADPSQ
jgi:polysaccharide deacetylase 2 family uncharacterized protein YibQ